MRNHRRRAFTLLEMLIVIAIMLVIGTLVVINVMGAKGKADVDTTIVQMRQFQAAIDNFRVDMKRLPTQDEGLKVLWSKEGLEESEAASWRPYLSEPKPVDHWGTAWIFKVPAEIEGIEFDIISAGPDKQEGSDDDISLARQRVKAAGGEDAFSDFKGSGTGVGTDSGGAPSSSGGGSSGR